MNQLEEDSKVIFLTETKCKIRFIYVGFNNKRKKWGRKMSGNYFLYSPKLNDSTNIFKENISIVRSWHIEKYPHFKLLFGLSSDTQIARQELFLRESNCYSKTDYITASFFNLQIQLRRARNYLSLSSFLTETIFGGKWSLCRLQLSLHWDTAVCHQGVQTVT